MNLDDRRRQIEKGIQIKSNTPIKESASKVLDNKSERNHSRNDAITPKEYQKLLNSTYEINKTKQALESRMILICCARLGMRSGEIAHLEEDWVKWNSKRIIIPEYSKCTKGKFNEVCGYCRNRAKDNLESHNLTDDEAIKAIVEYNKEENMSENEIRQKANELKQEVNVELEDKIQERWCPKNKNSARKIPFDFDPQVEIIVEDFFDEFDRFNKSFATLHRRLDKITELSPLEKNIYPHALRSTAASYQASRDISIHSLMSFMGWTDPGTARIYIQSNEKKAAEEIRSKN